MRLENIDYHLFKKAIEIYLKMAYPEGLPEAGFTASTINHVLEKTNKSDLLHEFEKVEISNDLDKKFTKYVIRLGCSFFPHLKLVLHESFNSQGYYGFLVDRHTEFLAIEKESTSFEQEISIKEKAKALKLAIEEKMEEEGVPTYRRIVRKYTQARKTAFSNEHIPKNGYRVFLVEDDFDVQQLHKLELELMGFAVDVATNGEEAITQFKENFYDAMLLDLMMPKISGFEVIRKLGSKIPIVVLSALDDKHTILECIEFGAKSFLTKPVQANTLRKNIMEAINK